MIAKTPSPPYIAAVFTSIRTDIEEGYDKMNELTFAELESIEGYLGYEAFRNENDTFFSFQSCHSQKTFE